MTVTDRSVTSRTVAQHIESVTHHSVSARTIRRRLQHSGQSARRPLLGLPLAQNRRRPADNCAMKEGRGLQNGMKLSLLTSHASVCNITMVGFKSGDTVERSPQWSCTGCYGMGSIFQQDNARPHVAHIVQRFFVNQQIELLLWPVRFPDRSPIENMWSMVAQRLTKITPHLPHQMNFGNVWKLLGLLYPKYTSKDSLNQCRGVWQR
ncbi:transposable element Tcb1 transposase [Trichonephila clavipes]|nr:transposable element Tcb1 transposase [Trichonephila clavipes]